MRAGGGLNDLFHGDHRWHFFLDVAFDAHLERHRTGGAAHAGAVQPDFRHPVGGDLNQFNIPAIGLHRGPDAFNDLLDPLKNMGVVVA